MAISMIKVSNVDFTDTDVDSMVKSTKVTFTLFLGIRERNSVLCLSSDAQYNFNSEQFGT